MKHDTDHDIQKEIDELKHNIKDLKALFIKKVTNVADRVPEAYHQGEDRVREQVETHPFQSVGFAAAIGFIVGALFTNKIK